MYVNMESSIFTFVLLVSLIQGIHSFKCYDCNGSDCLNITTKTMTVVECNSDSVCYSFRHNDSNGRVASRGCTKNIGDLCGSFADSYSSTNCKICSSDLCNNETIEPYNTTLCYKCNDDDACFDPVQNRVEQVRCNMETSFCYSHRYKYGVGYKVERGCYSGTNNLTVCNELSRVRTSSNCLACTTETCNYQRILKTPGMSCYDCNDENQCFHPEQYSIPITTCSSENAVCFAFQAYPDGVKKAYRGCFNDGGTTSEVKEKLNEKYKNINISKLSVCEQSNCNSLQLPLECYTCGGVNNYGGCLDPSSNPDTQINKCEPKANMTQVCTSYYISDAKKVVRRCANVDKTVLDVCDLISNQFEGGSKITQCNYCSEDLCNKDIINGASFNGLSFYTLIVGFGAVLLTGRL